MQHVVNRVFVYVGAENTISNVLNNRKMNIEEVQVEIIQNEKDTSENTHRKRQFNQIGKYNRKNANRTKKPHGKNTRTNTNRKIQIEKKNEKGRKI